MFRITALGWFWCLRAMYSAVVWECYLELGTDAGGLLLLVQVEQRLCSAIMQRQSHNELQRARIQQTLHSSNALNYFPS